MLKERYRKRKAEMTRYLLVIFVCGLSTVGGETPSVDITNQATSSDEVLRKVRQTTQYSEFDPQNFISAGNANAASGKHSSNPGVVSVSFSSGNFSENQDINKLSFPYSSFKNSKFSNEENQLQDVPQNSFSNQVFSDSFPDDSQNNDLNANTNVKGSSNSVNKINYNQNQNNVSFNYKTEHSQINFSQKTNKERVTSAGTNSGENLISSNQFGNNYNNNNRIPLQIYELPYTDVQQTHQYFGNADFEANIRNPLTLYVQSDNNKNLISNFASIEDIHTDTDDSVLGISLLSNDGINKNIANTHIITPVEDKSVLEPKNPFRVTKDSDENDSDPFESFGNFTQPFDNQITSNNINNNNNKQSNAFNEILSSTSKNNVGNAQGSSQIIDIPLIHSQKQFTVKQENSNDDKDSLGTFVTIRTVDLSNIYQGNFNHSSPIQGNNNQEFSNQISQHSFGIPLPASITGETSNSGNVDTFKTTKNNENRPGHNSDRANQITRDNAASSSRVESLPILRPKPVEVQSSDSVLKPLKDNIQIESGINPVSSLSESEASKVQDALGGMTLGELLMGINGRNGIMVVPMSEAKKANIPGSSANKLPFLDGESKQIRVREATSTTTTTSAPRTRRPSRRRTTTRPPDHIRRSLSDILYSKGQWFGTLIGGLIDYGRIVKDAFNNNIGTSTRDSYA